MDHDSVLKKGDIITKVDGKSVKEDTDLRTYLYENKKPGEDVKLTIIRDGKTETINVKLKKQVQSASQSSSEKQSQFAE